MIRTSSSPAAPQKGLGITHRHAKRIKGRQISIGYKQHEFIAESLTYKIQRFRLQGWCGVRGRQAVWMDRWMSHKAQTQDWPREMETSGVSGLHIRRGKQRGQAPSLVAGTGSVLCSSSIQIAACLPCTPHQPCKQNFGIFYESDSAINVC